MTKTKYINIAIIFIIHVFVVYALTYYCSYLGLSFPELKDTDKLLVFFISFVIYPVFMEGMAFRYPLKNDEHIYGALFCTLIVSFSLSIWLFPIAVIISAITLFLYKIKKKEKAPFILIVLFIAISSAVSIGIYTSESLEKLNYYELFFAFLPPVILASVTSFIRMKMNFTCATIYHGAYCLIMFLTLFCQNQLN